MQILEYVEYATLTGNPVLYFWIPIDLVVYI